MVGGAKVGCDGKGGVKGELEEGEVDEEGCHFLSMRENKDVIEMTKEKNVIKMVYFVLHFCSFSVLTKKQKFICYT